MTARFADRVALVTGGGSGIGRAIARAFAREGATVVVAGRRAEPLAETVAQIHGDGGTGGAAVADVTREEDVARLVATVLERHGRLDIASNTAGVLGATGPLHEVDEPAFAAVVNTNLTGLWLSMKHEIAHMRGNGGGIIVNTSSNVGAHMTRPGLGVYMATKAAVSALTRAAAHEYIGDGIRINAVSPGATATAMSLRPGETEDDRDARLRASVPLGRIGALDEVAAAVLWLASPEAGFAVGHDLVVDGGASA
jgi:NAD(P)-dependent dehydrogenase (short-subunit alcohol dehydrogenase family)